MDGRARFWSGTVRFGKDRSCFPSFGQPRRFVVLQRHEQSAACCCSARKAGQSRDTGRREMTVADVLVPERVVFLTDDVREEALKKLIALLAGMPGMPDQNALQKAFFEREEMMSTGIGLGLGVPHVRLPGVRNLAMAVGIL
jgi:hypothetical protein